MDEVRDNFIKIYEILILKHKRTFISKQMGFTSTCQLSNSLE